MSLVGIQMVKKGGKTVYLVAAMQLYGKANVLIPSPTGATAIEYNTLEEAKSAIIHAGYEPYLLNPNDVRAGIGENKSFSIDYNKIIDVFIKNLGNKSPSVRNSAIDALVKFGDSISEQLINSLHSSDWLTKQSVILCMEKIIQKNPDSAEIFINSIIETADYDNIAEIFIKNLNSERQDIRNSSINALSQFGDKIAEKLINTYENSGWLTKQSVILCMDKIINKNPESVGLFINTIIKASELENNLVKSVALKTLSKICDLNG